MRSIHYLLISLPFLLMACSKSDEKEQTGSESPEQSDVYAFTDNNGNNTVDYSGQTARLNQLEEIGTYIKSSISSHSGISSDQLKEMFSNNDGQGSAFFSNNAQSPGKDLESKCFAPNVNMYNDFFEAIEAISELGYPQAAEGQAGIITSLDGSRTYLFDENGKEIFQFIEKGLMGDVFYYQAIETYLEGSEQMSYDNTTAVDPDNGKYYTEAEHKFDEAFGYFGVPENYLRETGRERFYGKYCTRRNPTLNCTLPLMNAFIDARAAISSADQELLLENTDVIRAEWARVIQGTVLYYLKVAVANEDDPAVRLHVISEAWAFAGNLLFNSDSYGLSVQELEDFRTLLGDNFHQLTNDEINQAADFIFQRSQITIEELAQL